MAGKLKHKLLDLIHKKETELGCRLKVSEIAEGAKVSERLVYRWLEPNKPIKRFDDTVIIGFCDYFKCNVQDLIEYESEDSK